MIHIHKVIHIPTKVLFIRALFQNNSLVSEIYLSKNQNQQKKEVFNYWRICEVFWRVYEAFIKYNEHRNYNKLVN